MSSIFDLKTSVEELDSANQGTSRMAYEQHPPTRDVTNNNFANGAIHIRWETSGQKWWIPGRSYLRMRCNLTKADGTQLELADGVAPNMGLCASLFQNAEFRINEKVVSRIGDFMPQIDAIENRLSKSKSWLESVGVSTNVWEEDFVARQSIIAADGSKSGKVVAQELNAVQLGMTAGTTFAVAADTGIATFSENIALKVKKGDIVVSGGIEYLVSADVDAAATVQVSGAQTLALAATANWFVKRSVNTARAVKDIELIWKPPLSIFKLQHALPSGKYELVLNPQTSSAYQKYAIESLVDMVPNLKTDVAPTPNSNFKFNITDMYFYCNVVDGPRADDITYLLDLEQTACQSDKVDNSSFQQKNFDVSPATYALTVAYQDLRAGNDSSVSTTKFKVKNAGKSADSEELKLNRFFINYAGQNLPAPDADPLFVAGTDYTTQRYVESQLYSGAYFDNGGAESIEDYHNRGSYYYFAIPRDGTDRSTRVAVHQQFNNADTSNMRVLLFSHSKQVARIRVADSKVISVDLEDA